MTAQAGKDLLLKIGDGGTPEVFATVAGLRTRTLSLNAQVIDISHSESVGGWRELLTGAGLRQAALTGAGVFLSNQTAQSVRSVFFNGQAPNWRIILPGFGEIEGPFLIGNLDYGGDYDGEATVSLSLQSAGVLTFTPSAT